MQVLQLVVRSVLQERTEVAVVGTVKVEMRPTRTMVVRGSVVSMVKVGLMIGVKEVVEVEVEVEVEGVVEEETLMERPRRVEYMLNFLVCS